MFTYKTHRTSNPRKRTSYFGNRKKIFQRQVAFLKGLTRFNAHKQSNVDVLSNKICASKNTPGHWPLVDGLGKKVLCTDAALLDTDNSEDFQTDTF